MATFIGSTNNSNWTFKLEVSENSTDINSNTSNVTVNAYVGRKSTSSYMYGCSISCSIGITGCSNQTVSYQNSGTTSVSGGGWLHIGGATFNVPHDNDGNKTVTVSASFSNNVQPYSGSASGSMALSYIPRQANITNAPSSFTDEDNPWFSYSNPANASMTCWLEPNPASSHLCQRSLSGTGGTYTWSLTDSERDELRASCSSNSCTVRIGLYSTIGGTQYASYVDKTMTIVNGNPTFEDFEYQDTNNDVVSITGNNQILVKGLSILQASISTNNKMVANKKATAKNYIATIEDINKSVNYSTEDLTVELGTISSSGTKRLNVRAYDSRNNSTLVYKDIVVYDYAKPIINATATRLNNFENETTLKVSGTYSKLTINEEDKNTITSIQYRYRESGGTWSDWIDISSTISDGKFTCKDVILSLDNTKGFDFQVQVLDKLQTQTSELSVDIGQAIFFISSNNKTCYINGQEILMYDVVDEW